MNPKPKSAENAEDLQADASLPINQDVLNLLIENQSAFKAFLRRHVPSDAVAEDILQQSVLKAIFNPIEGVSS